MEENFPSDFYQGSIILLLTWINLILNYRMSSTLDTPSYDLEIAPLINNSTKN